MYSQIISKRSKNRTRNVSLRNYLNVMLIMLGLLNSLQTRADLLEDHQVNAEMGSEIDYVKECGLNLLEAVQKTSPESRKLPELYKKHSVDKDDEFLEYLYSVMYVESGFNKTAISHADAYGLLQMTRVAVEEAVKHCNLRPLGDMNKLHDSVTNVKYGSCYLKKMLDEADGDWTRALILYNGGYKQLQKYDRGDTVTHETANYVLKVERALKNICRKPRDLLVDNKKTK